MAFLWQRNEDNHNVQFVGYSCNKRPWFTAPPPHQNDTRVSLWRGMNHVEEFCSDAIARPGSTHSKEQVVVVRTPGEDVMDFSSTDSYPHPLSNYHLNHHHYSSYFSKSSSLLSTSPTWYTAWSHGGTWDAGPSCQALGPLWFRWLWLSASSRPVGRS